MSMPPLPIAATLLPQALGARRRRRVFLITASASPIVTRRRSFATYTRTLFTARTRSVAASTRRRAFARRDAVCGRSAPPRRLSRIGAETDIFGALLSAEASWSCPLSLPARPRWARRSPARAVTRSPVVWIHKIRGLLATKARGLDSASACHCHCHCHRRRRRAAAARPGPAAAAADPLTILATFTVPAPISVAGGSAGFGIVAQLRLWLKGLHLSSVPKVVDLFMSPRTREPRIGLSRR